jgi:hypothetical protein
MRARRGIGSDSAAGGPGATGGIGGSSGIGGFGCAGGTCGIGDVRRALRLGAAALLPAAALAQTQEDIRDIRGPKAMPAWPWVVTALLAAALIGTLYAIRAIRRRRGRGDSGRSLSLTQRTLERLEGARPLMQPATAREFGIAASEAIRGYIEARFKIVATQRTTEEFLQALLGGSSEALARHRVRLEGFLRQCDLVKFAGTSLAAADLEALFESARGFVLETGDGAA